MFKKFNFFIIFCIFVLCFQLFLTFYTLIFHFHLIIIILNLISLFLYGILSYFFITQNLKLSNLLEKFENLQNYNDTLSNLYDNIKAFKHDFNNIVYTIGGFISNNDMANLKKYYNNLTKDCQRVNNLSILNPQIINNSGIYNLLIEKLKKAKNDKVEINIEVFLDFNKLNMPIYEFSRILGILIDNAIEAASTSHEKLVNIIFRDSTSKHTQLINIENTYSNKDIDTSRIFEKGITEKENHTGMGLWEVNEILKRINNAKLNTLKDQKYFKQQIEIFY